MQDQINLIREKCIEANPSIKEEWIGWFDEYGNLDHSEKTIRDIRLADVLLAITFHDPIRYIAISAPGCWLEIKNGKYQNCQEDGMESWDLRKDSLESQSPKCIEFLANLLK